MAPFFCSCGNNKGKKQEGGERVVLNAIELDERLNDADSLVVVFYKDPYGEDSLRYTRYYIQASTTATSAIDTLHQQLTQQFTRQEKRRNCRGEGKIWCFAKGKVFQTLYFSTRCDNNCCYLYLIKDGNFYYSPVQQSLVVWLLSVKKLATEPPNEAADDGNKDKI